MDRSVLYGIFFGAKWGAGAGTAGPSWDPSVIVCTYDKNVTAFGYCYAVNAASEEHIKGVVSRELRGGRGSRGGIMAGVREREVGTALGLTLDRDGRREKRPRTFHHQGDMMALFS